MRQLKALLPRSLRGAIASRLRGRQFESRDVIRQRYLGEELSVVNADGTSMGWYGADWPEGSHTEFDFLASLGIPRDGMLFAIGAHQGIVAMLLKRKLVPQGKVVSVEMDALNAMACAENYRINSESGIVNLNVAISDRSGTLRAAGRSNSRIVTDSSIFSVLYPTIPTISIADMVTTYGRPDAIYLDIEGAEVLALKGAGIGLGSVPVWYVELHGAEQCGAFGGSNHSVVESFLGANYRVYFTADDDKPLLQLHDIADLPTKRCFMVATLIGAGAGVEGSSGESMDFAKP